MEKKSENYSKSMILTSYFFNSFLFDLLHQLLAVKRLFKITQSHYFEHGSLQKINKR